MARNPIGFGPMGIPSLEADPAQAAQPKPPVDPIGALATKYQVPRNVLMALDEDGQDLEASAASIAQKVKSGGKLEDAVPRSVMVRAYDIADAIDGVKPEGGLGKALGLGVDIIQQSYGSAIEGVGKKAGLKGVEEYGREVAEFNEAEAASRSRGMTRLDDVEGVGSFGKFAVETAAQQVPQMGTTLGGAATGAAMGSPGGPIGMAAGGVAGAITANIPFFYGQHRERQKEADEDAGRPVEVSEGAAFLSSIWSAGLDAFGDLIAATGVGLGPSVLARGGSGLLTRVVTGVGKGAAAGATVEVPTEIGQSIIERAQAGLPLFTDDAMKEYVEVGVAAGLLGAGLGGAGGGVKAYRSGTGPGREEEEQNPVGDGSVDGQGTGPVAAPLPGGEGPVPDTMQAPPAGPIGRAAAQAPDLTPQPEPEAQAPRFPDLKTGQEIQLRDPETGQVMSAVFLGEDDGTPMVRLPSSPDPVDIDAALFNEMYVGGKAATEEGADAKTAEDQPLAQPPEVSPAAALLIDHFDERVAILEYDGGFTREEAEARAAQSTLAMMGQMDPAELADDRVRQLEASLTAMASAVAPEPEPAPTTAQPPQQPAQPEISAPPAAPEPEVAPPNVPPSQPAAPAPAAAPSAPQPPSPPTGEAVAGPAQPTPPVEVAPESAPAPESAAIQGEAPRIENIRKRAAILRGVPKGAAPAVEGVSLKWDDKEGGFVFSRKHVEKVRAALLGGAAEPAQAPAEPTGQKETKDPGPAAQEDQQPKPEVEAAEAPQEPTAPPVEDGRNLSKRQQAREAGRAAAKAGEDRTPPSYLNDELGREWLAGYADESAKLKEAEDASKEPTPATPVEEPQAPTAEEIDKVASETDPNPTPAQAEAENYKTAKIDWQGLKLSIENKKGSTRRGYDADGNETWSVEMPAHYGRILGATGADGDHVDFYMGEHPDSEKVWIVDQIDPETGKFDEHKVMLGFKNKRAAVKVYDAAFSDGSGKKRRGAVTETTVGNFKQWLEDPEAVKKPAGKLASSLPQEWQEGEAQPAAPKVEKIEDFGEKIGGARKDAAKKYLGDLSRDDIRGMTLGEAIPEPAYKKLREMMVPAQTLAMVSFIRAGVRRKPRPDQTWAIPDWVDEAIEAREKIAKLISGDIAVKDLFDGSMVDAKITSLVADSVDIEDMGAAGRALPGLNSYTFRKMVMNEATTDADIKAYIASKIAAHKKKASRESFDFKFHIRHTRSTVGRKYYIYASKPRLVKMRTYDTREEASEVLKDPAKRAELQAEAMEMKAGPPERRLENRPRVGPDRRKGNVSAEKFSKAFGFRGVEFGNYVKAEERQGFLNAAYDALMDLAGALGVPPRALSLNGELGMAFGARGWGNRGNNPAAAHYEPGYVVMNLTKDDGAGSLAHEWWHALDHFVARNVGHSGPKLQTEIGNRFGRNADGAEVDRRSKLVGALLKAVRTLRYSSYGSRMERLDELRSKPYWSAPEELTARGFEALVNERLEDRNMVNDFLVNINKSGGAYPNQKDMGDGIRREMNAAVREVVKILQAEGKAPDMFDLVPMARTRPPQVGDQWESLDGRRTITGVEDRDGGRQVFVLETEGGETVKRSADKIEEIRGQDAWDMSPEGTAERNERERLQAERDAKRKAAEEKQAAADARAKEFSEYRGKTIGHMSWMSEIDSVVDLGGVLDRTKAGGALVAPEGSPEPGSVLMTLNGGLKLEYAEWALKRKSAGKKLDPKPEMVFETEEPQGAPQDADQPENDDNLDEMFDGILDEETADAEPEQAGGEEKPKSQRLALGLDFAQAFSDGIDVSNITKARRFARERAGREVPDKELEESIEAGLVLRAREITADARLDPSEKFEAMVALYKAQPNLITRTSTSVEQQAYSTPAPLAYLASRLARITRNLNGRIYEPTAGNGMLLMEADPKNVVANEINPDRFAVLEGIYRDALLTQGDATAIDQAVQFDRVIANPPFGKVKDGKVSKRFDLGGVKTTEIDHAIAWKALGDMKDTGRAVLIIGGHRGDPAERQKGYKSDNHFRFMTKLYDAYNVVEHFTVDGKLYTRQGAGWPVDVIVIDGKGKSDLRYPYVDAPPLYSDWETLGERLNNGSGSLDTRRKRVGSRDDNLPRDADGTGDAGTGDEPSGPQDQPDGGTVQPGGDGSGAGVRPGDDGGAGNAGSSGQLPSGRGGRSAGPRGAGSDGVAEQPVAGQPGADPAGVDQEPGADRGDRGDRLDGVSGNGTRVEGDRTAGEAAASAAQNVAESWEDIGKGLSALFDFDPNRLNSGPAFDEEAYAKAKPFFISAVKKVGAAGKDIADVMRAVIRALVNEAKMTKQAIQNMKPYVTRFVDEVRKGIIPAKDLEAAPTQRKPAAATGKKERENTEAETDYQVQYAPHSNAEFAVGTLVPRNMQDAVDDALGALKERVGDIDAFVAERLGMTPEQVTGTAKTPGYFSAEQVDALALAIDNIEQGGGFIIGDQTGVGKGRVVAGVLVYAMRQGKIPVFVTKQPGLFGDMVRDLRDIGQAGIESQILPSKALRGKDAVPLSNEPGDVLTSPSDAKLKQAMANMRKTGKLPEGYSMFFTNYSQMRYKAGTIGGKTNRQMALDAIAPNAVIVLDESHEAGGTETRRIDKDTGQPVPTSADYFREVLGRASGVMYSSATYAKNPTVMSLYGRTDIRFAFEKMDDLSETVKSGGVPLQQVMANMLVRSGQYMRRERSYEGVSMDLAVLPTDQELATRSSKMVAQVFDLDRDYMVDAREAFVKKLEEGGLIGGKDNSVGETGAEQIGFASVMHNLINQTFFALKADAVVQQAIEKHKAGEKILIAVSNTNESILRDYVEAANIQPDGAVDMPFNELFKRYLQRLRRVKVKDANDREVYRFMTDADLADVAGPDALKAFKDVEKAIENTDFSGIPSMPLDYVLDRLQDAGIKVGEITGRSMTSRGGKLTQRDKSDAAKKRTMNDFNSGKIDAVILNQSGSTGFSLHAKDPKKHKDNDGKKRHMIVLQPDPNIDVFMQMLGRIHRTGQSQLPGYTIAVSDLALEKRVAANLMRKMASLNANTTAAKDSAVSLDNVVDFMNVYGDQVIAEILREDTELSNRLNIRVGGKGAPPAGLSQRVTGRLAVLTPAEVSDLYDRIEQSYVEYVEALDRMGLNMLEAKTLDLQAKTVSEQELVAARGGANSVFADGAAIETVDVRRLGRPFTTQQINDEYAKETGGNVTSYMREVSERLDSLVPAYREKMVASLSEARERLAAAVTDSQKKRAQESVGAWESKISDISTKLTEIKTELEKLRPGKAVYLKLVEDGQEYQFYAVSLGINVKGLKDNPTAASAIRVRFAIADASREVTIPLSKFLASDSPFSFTEVQNMRAVQKAFDGGQTESREERQIITGNILSGYAQFKRGQIVMFTREDGSIDQGVLMPKAFDLEAELAAKPVPFPNPARAIDFLDAGNNRLVKTEDSIVQISRMNYGGYKVQVRRMGGKPYILNPAVREVVGDFESGRGSKGTFDKTISDAGKLRRVLEIWSDQVGASYLTETFKDEARALLGQSIPGKEMRKAAEAGGDPAMTPADVRAVAAEVSAELARSIPGGKIKAKVVRELVSRATGRPIEGRQTGRQIEVKADAQVGAVGVMRHEIVHALRDEAVWGQPYGLFTKAEWRDLVRTARSNPDLVAAIEERYPDLPTATKSEEMVAEMYRSWADGRDKASPSARTFEKIRGFLTALANALRGRGFVSASRTMEQIATGKVGGRGPQGPGGGNGSAREMRRLNEWTRQVFQALTGKLPVNASISMGTVPEIVRRLGGRGSRMVMAVSKLRKVVKDHPEVTVEAIARLPQMIADPVFVLRNEGDQRSGDMLFVTDMVLGDDSVLVASIKLGGRDSDGQKATVVVTAYGKDQFSEMMRRASERGQIVYVRGVREGSGYKHTGANSLNAPLRGTMSALRASSKIQTPGSIFKTGDTGKEMRAPLGAVREKFSGMIGTDHWQSPSEWMSSRMTDWMASKDWSSLSLAPGRALFAELGKSLHSSRAYLRTKEEMDALRNEWHNRAAEVADRWISKQSENPDANADMMDLMHRATLAGIDPTKKSPVDQDTPFLVRARGAYARDGESAPNWVKEVISEADTKQKSYDTIRGLYKALPGEYQKLFREVKQTYEMLANDFDKAVEANIKNAARIALKRAEKAHRKEMARIRDEGLDGAEKEAAIAAADARLAKVKKRAGMGVKAKIRALRQQFESQRLKGPYFPLARFGDFWVTVRDDDGKVISFARFEREKDQQRHIREMEEANPGRVTYGLMKDKAALRDQVDPKFVADVESMLSEADASPELMDAIWQRYLETMPDQSIRTSKIHRKGRAGFNTDALRAFTSHMFHGAHQLARLQYGLNLDEHIDDAYDEAAQQPNPNRATAIVNEMARRKEWTLNPTGAAWSAVASSIAFVWYLGVSPAAALVNLSQTTIVGPGVMKAAFKGVGTGKILSELARAAKDFGKGQGVSWRDLWSAENSPDITRDEHAALQEGYRRGTIDRTQAYDLAAVAETGIEYNPIRERWMRRFGWAFHHAERTNREVTFLANYRIAREKGFDHDAAIEKAADLTWKIHFSYQNSDRPRFMHNDYMKVLTIFRQFTVNMLFRMFRDAHQSLRGATEAERAEAKTQLIGITLSMMAHAGIKGVWGYGLLMGLLGIFFPGGSDDAEEWLHDALLMEGDTPGAAAWNYAMGAALNGVPGQITGISLTERVGMPNLWFRDSFRDLEGADLVQHYVNELLGPTVSIAFSIGRGAQYIGEGDVVRGIEASVPKFVRDVIRSGRYAAEGVNTRNGDPLVEDVNPWELLVQASGFTPARVAERYDINSRLKNRERRIVDERRDIQRAAGDAIRAGEPIPDHVMEKIRDFNRRFPEYPITGDTLRQSVRARMRASDRNEFGVSLNSRLNDRLRGDLAPAIYS